MLEKEEDFKESMTLLEERIALKGAKLMFLPRFHPELNPIECVYRFGFLSKRIMVNSLTNTPGILQSTVERTTSSAARLVSVGECLLPTK